MASSRTAKQHSQHCSLTGGGDWIRTSVGVSQQIYSLPPLATRAPLRRISNSSTTFINTNKNRQKDKRFGAAGGDRTHDHWLRRPILYPLSYSRTLCFEPTRRLLHEQALRTPRSPRWIACCSPHTQTTYVCTSLSRGITQTSAMRQRRTPRQCWRQPASVSHPGHHTYN